MRFACFFCALIAVLIRCSSRLFAGEVFQPSVDGLGRPLLVPAPFPRMVPGRENEGMDAPRGLVEFEGTDELQRLRRRAYGPDADIAGDAVAQARLSELEAAQRRQSTLVVYAAARGPAAVSERVPVSEPVEGRRSASTSVPQPVEGSSPSVTPLEVRSPGNTPPRGRSPIPTPSTDLPRHRGGAAAAGW